MIYRGKKDNSLLSVEIFVTANADITRQPYKKHGATNYPNLTNRPRKLQSAVFEITSSLIVNYHVQHLCLHDSPRLGNPEIQLLSTGTYLKYGQ